VAAGVDLVLTETTLAARSMDDLEREFTPSARIAPTEERQGIRIASLPRGSIARAAGLQDGDVITAVNGYALSSPDAALEAYESLRRSRAAIIELRRGAALVVLKVGFAGERR
jgi:S1-C subfamily serine protease